MVSVSHQTKIKTWALLNYDDYDADTCKSLGDVYTLRKRTQNQTRDEIVLVFDNLCGFPSPLIELVYHYCRESPRKFDHLMIKTRETRNAISSTVLKTISHRYASAYRMYNFSTLLLLETARWKHHGQLCLERFSVCDLQGEWKMVKTGNTNAKLFVIEPDQLEAAQKHLYDQMTPQERFHLCGTHKDIPFRIGLNYKRKNDLNSTPLYFKWNHNFYNYLNFETNYYFTLELALTGVCFPIRFPPPTQQNSKSK